MMFRIEKFNLRSNTEIQFKFNQELDQNLTTANVKIVSSIPSVPDLLVKSVRVKKSVLSVVTNQQQAMVLYQVFLLNTSTQPFQSKDKESLQNLNALYFIGQEKTNDIRDSMLEALSKVYNVDHTSIVRKIISGLSDNILQARTDIREIGSANYLSEPVVDEIYTRGFGPTDRLFSEGAFQLQRVAKNATGTSIANKLSLKAARTQTNNLWDTGFTSDPISLRSIVVTETVSNAETVNNSFDGLLISLSKPNVAVLLSVQIGQTVYDIQKYGYAVLDNRYDTRFGRKLLTINTNQFKLAEQAVIDGSFPLPSSNSEIVVSYIYTNNGVNVDDATIEVSQVKRQTREAVPALLNIFNLKGFPIVTAQDLPATRGAVSFLDPEPVAATPFTVTHPAFQNEIPYSVNRMPDSPGQYSIDYSTGRVFVYGSSNANDGTGTVPPVASYLYRKIFVNNLDYNFSEDRDEVAASPIRDLIGQPVTIRYSSENVLQPGIDYLDECHIEVHSEYVDNRFNGQNCVFPLHRPVTDVFEVINETTGERYSVTRSTDDAVFFNGFNLPRFTDHNNESVKFSEESSENLYVEEDIFSNVSQKLVKFSLKNDQIIARSNAKIGSNTNTSVLFSKPDLFVQEFYFDSVLQSLSDNLSKINSVGDYLVDYKDGIVYLRTDAAEEDFGTISYKYAAVRTVYPQILSVADLEYRSTIKSDPVLRIMADEFSSESIVPQQLPETIERFFSGVTEQPILLGSVAFGLLGQMHIGSYEFVASDGNFDDSLLDGYHILRITGEPDRAITAVTSATTMLVDIPFTEFNLNASWSIIDFDFSDGYKTSATYDIKYVNGVYSVQELQTLPFTELTNYFVAGIDNVDGKDITFNSSAIKSLPPGTALAIDYSFGQLYVNYTVVQDIVRISYEYGDNSVNFSIADALSPEEQYFVTYKYGALRDKLLENFGALTQVQELTTFPTDLNRELYRSFLIGTLQGFLNGPTNPSIKTLVESVTEIKPTIREFDFGQWTIGRDSLYPVKPKLGKPAVYDSAKYGNGLVFDSNQTLRLPSESYLSLKEGTFEAWVKPYWDGIDNDATITFTVNADPSSIFIGSRGYNPESNNFSVSKADAEPDSSVGQPFNFAVQPGHYVWFDDLNNDWHYVATKDGYGEIGTTGEMYDVQDGYQVTSTTTQIIFDGYQTQQDGYLGPDGYASLWHLKFKSDNTHRVFDTGPSLSSNRMTVYKNGSGYLVYKIYDKRSHQYVISHNIQDWEAGDLHHVACSWKLNSVEAVDEMHLFVDGLEVSNLFRIGGKPQVTIDDLFGQVADEFLTLSATKTIIGNDDGKSVSGSNEFSSLGTDFIDAGIIAGDLFAILDATADGIMGPYTISSVTQHTLTISSALTLTLDGVSFSVNRQTFNVSTNLDVEKIAVFVSDGYTREELAGVDALEPDYSIGRIAGQNTITINNGVTTGDQVIVNTLGLNTGRCVDEVYLYRDDGYQIQTRGAPPANLEHFSLYKVQFPRTSIQADGYGPYGDGYGSFQETSPNVLQGTFTAITPPSNTVNGKSLALVLGGFDNIDFSGTNQVQINGSTFGGPSSEVINFTSYGTQVTSNFFISITSLDMTFTAKDDGYSLGSITVMEAFPVTQEENNGDYAMPTEYDNGVFSFAVYGAISMTFTLGHGWYILDYPTALSILVDRKGPLFIGSSIDGIEQFNGVLDQVIFLNEQLTDIRKGEDTDIQRSITTDYNSPIPLEFTPQTLLLLSLNDEIDSITKHYKSFNENTRTSSLSVNKDFGDSIVFYNKPYEIDNAAVVFNQNSVTVEFWVSPYLDTRYDNFKRYYLDVSSFVSDEIISGTRRTVELSRRAKKIISVRLASDVLETGKDYFADDNSKLFVNGTTVFLGSSLPDVMTLLRVKYVPIESTGNRISIYKSENSFLNFSVVSGDNEYVISVPINWQRNTWHRVKALLKANTSDDKDQMRLFIDGNEGGTVLWGSPGLLYGSGFTYGSADAGSSASQTITANIDLTDTLSSVFLGNSYDYLNPAKCRMDNVRFSNSIRQPSVIANIPMDLNYSESLETVSPVVEDDFTTLLLDFNRDVEETEFLANLISKYTPLFYFEILIDDSFRHLTDERSRNIMSSVLHRMKQSHTNIFIKYLQDL